jgi:hypothetical protein
MSTQKNKNKKELTKNECCDRMVSADAIRDAAENNKNLDN